jgi:hypothetical protein
MNGRFCTGCGMPFAPALSSTSLLSTPTAAPPPRRWAKFIGISAAVIGVIVILSALGHPDSQSPSSNSAATAKENPEPTTANALFRAYHANEVTADEFYKGRLLAVSGRVAEIRKDFSDGIYVELQTENEFESVRAELSDGQAGNASALFKGASVTVVCRGAGMILGSPGLKDCSIK